jgi:hypothetical protein
MEPLILQETGETPKVNFDLINGLLLISGRSLPENAVAFYKPLIDWVDHALLEAEGLSPLVELKLEYFNTASSKQLAKLLLKIEEYKDRHAITIRWYYEKEDNDMYISGSQFAKFLSLKFEFIAI